MEGTSITARRGFGAMSLEKRTAAARKGGENVPSSKRAYSRDPALAAMAGRKGGMNSKGGGRPRASPA